MSYVKGLSPGPSGALELTVRVQTEAYLRARTSHFHSFPKLLNMMNSHDSSE